MKRLLSILLLLALAGGVLATPPTPVSVWHLNEASGDALDSVGSNQLTHTATDPGTTTGKLNGARTFSGASNNWFTINDNASLSNANNNFAFAAWVKLTSKTNPSVIISKSAAGTSGVEYNLRYAQGTDRFTFTCSHDGTTLVNATANTFGSPSAGTWYFIYCYYDTTNVGISVNNGTVDTTAFTTGPQDSTNAFRIGAHASGVNIADAAIDEVVYWKTTIPNSTDVTALYNGGTGLEYPYSVTPAIVATDQTASRVFQRAAGTNAKTITFSGTYAGTVPTTIEVQIYQDGTSTVVQSFTALSSATISGGTWSGTLSVPQGTTWFNSKARSKDGGGSVLATDSQTSNKWGVGILVAMLGQSNMERMWLTSSSPPTVNALTRAYNGSWGTTAGNGAIRFSDKLQTDAGCPIGLLEYAVDGSGLVYDDTHGIWDSLTAGQPYVLFTTGLTAVGGDCEFVYWHQGEADMKGATAGSTYKTSLDTVYGRIRTATGRSTSQLRWLTHITGSFSSSPATDASVDTIRQAEMQWLAVTTGAYWAGATTDISLIDTAHHDALGYEREARRGAQAFGKLLGAQSFGANGPHIVSATRSSAVITITVAHDGGSGLTELDGTTDGGSVTGFEVSNDGFSSTLTISSTAFTAGKIVLTLSSPPTGTVQLRYQYGKTPSITNPVFDNTSPEGDSVGLPLQPQSAMTVGAKTPFYYYLNSALKPCTKYFLPKETQYALSP